MPRILIIDDEPIALLLLTRSLERRGFRCVTAANLVEAVDAVRRERFDFTLLDWYMASESGATIYDAMIAVRPEIADGVCVLSNSAPDADGLAFVARTGVAWVMKSFDEATVTTILNCKDCPIAEERAECLDADVVQLGRIIVEERKECKAPTAPGFLAAFFRGRS